ncbi:MAG: glycosyltransferase [Bacilli bacterium]|jgi:glycosyltransferase involved in cell wall biosynthesis|nr:glycosyltransferase [Bacilli bacterium]
MAKQKIYWFVQQFQRFGGTEEVTLTLIDMLKETYDITIVVDEAYDKKTKPVFHLPLGVKIISLNLPLRYFRIDEFCLTALREHHYLKLLGGIFYEAYMILMKRFILRRKIKRMTEKDALLIASSLDNYILMPHQRKVFFHYHFNFQCLNSFAEHLQRLVERKPDKWIFITEGTLKEANKHHPFKNKSAMVYNPNRLPPRQSFDFKGGEVIFLGRFSEQKRPLFLIKIASELKKLNVNFHFSLYGEGILKEQLEEGIKEAKLEDKVSILHPIPDPSEALLKSDLLLLPSKYEGWGLVIGEANSQGVPVLSSDWGSGLKEAMEDGVNGYIFYNDDPKAYAEKIAYLFTHLIELQALKKTSFAYASRLGKEAIKEEWVKIIEKKN